MIFMKSILFLHASASATSELMTDFVPKLYFSPGAVSMATHMALEEAGIPYTLEPVLIKEGQQLSERYRRIHPLGRLPAVEIAPDVVLTETPALLAYVAALAPGLR